MTPRLFGIERWAARRPGTRYPLLLLALLLLIGLAGGITGCGGSSDSPAADPAPTVLATDTSTAQAGDSRVGAHTLVLPLPGPVVELPAPAHVRVHISARLLQAAHYPATAHASIALQQPQPTGPSSVAWPLGTPAAAQTLDYTVLLALPAGATALQALLRVQATGANGLPTAALAHADVVAHWRVELLP